MTKKICNIAIKKLCTFKYNVLIFNNSRKKHVWFCYVYIKRTYKNFKKIIGPAFIKKFIYIRYEIFLYRFKNVVFIKSSLKFTEHLNIFNHNQHNCRNFQCRVLLKMPYKYYSFIHIFFSKSRNFGKIKSCAPLKSQFLCMGKFILRLRM